MTLRLTKALLLSLALSSPAAAQTAEPVLIGTFRDWSAFILTQDNGAACWMASRPKKQSGDPAKRGEPFVLVTHRPSEHALDVVSILAGYTYDKSVPVTVQIGTESFTLTADGDTAWAKDAELDRALAKAIRQGSTMVVRAASSRGTRTTDTYSLAGTGAAYQAMSQACGVGG